MTPDRKYTVWVDGNKRCSSRSSKGALEVVESVLSRSPNVKVDVWAWDVE
jgi:hypothetical protein